jgi:hypothetical protein
MLNPRVRILAYTVRVTSTTSSGDSQYVGVSQNETPRFSLTKKNETPCHMSHVRPILGTKLHFVAKNETPRGSQFIMNLPIVTCCEVLSLAFVD